MSLTHGSACGVGAARIALHKLYGLPINTVEVDGRHPQH